MEEITIQFNKKNNSLYRDPKGTHIKRKNNLFTSIDKFSQSDWISKINHIKFKKN